VTFRGSWSMGRLSASSRSRTMGRMSGSGWVPAVEAMICDALFAGHAGEEGRGGDALSGVERANRPRLQASPITVSKLVMIATVRSEARHCWVGCTDLRSSWRWPSVEQCEAVVRGPQVRPSPSGSCRLVVGG